MTINCDQYRLQPKWMNRLKLSKAHSSNLLVMINYGCNGGKKSRCHKSGEATFMLLEIYEKKNRLNESNYHEVLTFSGAVIYTK